MRAHRLVPALALVVSLAPIAAHADACDAELSMEYAPAEATLHFELNTQTCSVGAPIDIEARFGREGPIDGMEQVVTTTCPTTDTCVVDLALEHGPIEYAEYEGVVSYESVWDDGFLSGGVFLSRTCISLVAASECPPL